MPPNSGPATRSTTPEAVLEQACVAPNDYGKCLHWHRDGDTTTMYSEAGEQGSMRRKRQSLKTLPQSREEEGHAPEWRPVVGMLPQTQGFGRAKIVKENWIISPRCPLKLWGKELLMLCARSWKGTWAYQCPNKPHLTMFPPPKKKPNNCNYDL